MKIKSISFGKYKCFEEIVSLDLGSKVTLLIGKNNIGKTSTLEAIRYIFTEDASSITVFPQYLSTCVELSERNVESGFGKHTYDEYPTGYYNAERSLFGKYGKHLVGKPFEISLSRNGKTVLGDYVAKQPTVEEHEKQFNCPVAGAWSAIASDVVSGFPRYHVIRVSAERDILPEIRSKSEEIDEKGNGVTSAIDSLINDVGKNFALVEEKLLEHLNDIVRGETKYERILTQQTELTKKHIYLSENGHRIALDHMGSGIKTILFVVFSLLYFTEKYGEKAMFLFEEIENNLHPEVQRRLFDFVYRFAVEKNVKVFLSSHSNVAINYFYGKPDCVIDHVYREGNSSRIKSVQSTASERELLSDLGVRASDMMQSNGVIWVEGPSDRIYINKWIELKDPSLKENEHYTFLYYGGKLLSHLEAEDDQLSKRIAILKTNRNAAVVIDSDIREEGKEINDTKKRIKEELEKSGQLVWITSGKEIENYLLKQDLAKVFGAESITSQVGKYELFPEYIKTVDPDFSSHKVDFARKVRPSISSDSFSLLDLGERIDELVRRIRLWNGLPEE